MTVAGNPPQPTDKLSGLIDRVTYFSETTGFAVLRVKASGHRDLVTVVGSLPVASAGVADCRRNLGAGSGARTTAQSHGLEDRAAQHEGWNREIFGQRNGQGDWPRFRKE